MKKFGFIKNQVSNISIFIIYCTPYILTIVKNPLFRIGLQFILIIISYSHIIDVIWLDEGSDTDMPDETSNKDKSSVKEDFNPLDKLTNEEKRKFFSLKREIDLYERLAEHENNIMKKEKMEFEKTGEIPEISYTAKIAEFRSKDEIKYFENIKELDELNKKMDLIEQHVGSSSSKRKKE